MQPEWPVLMSPPLQIFLSRMNAVAGQNNNTPWRAAAKGLPISAPHCPSQDSVGGDLQIIRMNFIPPQSRRGDNQNLVGRFDRPTTQNHTPLEVQIGRAHV